MSDPSNCKTFIAMFEAMLALPTTETYLQKLN
jgi:hypothetical protein